jgi:hypothetical protein
VYYTFFEAEADARRRDAIPSSRHLRLSGVRGKVRCDGKQNRLQTVYTRFCNFHPMNVDEIVLSVALLSGRGLDHR